MTSSEDPKNNETAAAADPRLAFEREKWIEERKLRERELAVKEAERPSPWRSPLVIAVVAAAAAAGGNAIVSRVNASSQVTLERVKAEQNLIIEAIKTGGNVETAAANLGFLVDTRLVTDGERAVAIRRYLRANRNRPDLLPSLPSVGQTQPPPRRPRPGPQPAVVEPDPLLAPAPNPNASITRRASTIRPNAECSSATAAGQQCVQDGVLLAANGRPVRLVDARRSTRDIRAPQAIVLHFDGGPDDGAVRAYSSDSRSLGSAHIVIERDGRVTQLLPFDVGATHVGAGEWEGITALNGSTIGVMFANWGRLNGAPGAWRLPFGDRPIPDSQVLEIRNEQTGEVTGWERFTEAQLQAAEEVIRALIRRYPTIRGVVGHDEVARPRGRKIDPGPAMPYERFRALLPRREASPAAGR